MDLHSGVAKVTHFSEFQTFILGNNGCIAQ